MKFKKATKDNYSIYLELNKEIQLVHHEEFPSLFKPTADILSEEEYLKLISNPNLKTLLAVEEDKVIGYFICEIINKEETPFRYKSTFLYVHHIVIGNAHQRKGYGKNLIAQIKQIAQKAKVNEIQITVWSFNTKAKRFYDAMGFKTFHEKMVLKLN